MHLFNESFCFKFSFIDPRFSILIYKLTKPLSNVTCVSHSVFWPCIILLTIFTSWRTVYHTSTKLILNSWILILVTDNYILPLTKESFVIFTIFSITSLISLTLNRIDFMQSTYVHYRLHGILSEKNEKKITGQLFNVFNL